MLTGRRQLREWLTRSRRSQAQFAAMIGVTEGFMSQVISGLRRPKLETLVTIEGLTGIPVSAWAEPAVSEPDQPVKSGAK